MISQAAFHGLAPLLYWELKRSCADLVPAAILAGFRERFLINARRNLLLSAELLRIVTVLKHAGIDVLPFKGPAISWTLYENPALREMSDLDLLVRPRDARRAYDLLVSDGYEPVYPKLHWRFLHSHNCEAALLRGEVVIDLHWETMPRNFRPARDAEAAWRRSQLVPVARGLVPTFSPEDLFIFLCVHGGKHCWSQLTCLADVSRLVAREAIDWQLVLERARAAKSCRAVSLALALMRDLLRVPIPLEAEAILCEDDLAQRLANQVREALLSGSNGLRGTVSQLRFWLALSTGPVSKARVLWQPLQPQIADQLWWRLPVWLSPVYYVTRPFRLAAKYALRTRSAASWPRVPGRSSS